RRGESLRPTPGICSVNEEERNMRDSTKGLRLGSIVEVGIFALASGALAAGSWLNFESDDIMTAAGLCAAMGLVLFLGGIRQARAGQMRRLNRMAEWVAHREMSDHRR